MAFNPLALLGGLQGFVSKNEETSNKINAMKQQGVELQDMLKQRQRAQERENVVQAQQDALYALNLGGLQRSDELAKILHGYQKQAAPNEGQAMVDTSALNAGVVKHNLNNQPRLFKLDDLELGNRETLLPMQHQFQVGEARHALGTQGTRQGLDIAGLAQQGVEFKNAWMRPYRGKYYQAQAAYDDAMQQATNKALPYTEQMKAYMVAMQAKNAGQSALLDAAAEAKAQGYTDNSWQQYFQQDPSGLQFSGASFKGPAVPPVGLLTDPSVLGMFDQVIGMGNTNFNPTQDLSTVWPTYDPATKTIKNATVSVNNKNNERFLATGFMPQFISRANATGNYDIAKVMGAYTGLKGLVQGKHFTDTSVPVNIVDSNGKVVKNPLHEKLMEKAKSGPLTKEQFAAIDDANKLMETRVGHLVGLINASTQDDISKRESAKAAMALAQAGWTSFATSMQQTLNTLAARTDKLVAAANLNPTLLQSMVPQAIKDYQAGKASKQTQAILAWDTFHRFQQKYWAASANPGSKAIKDLMADMEKENFRNLFPDIVAPAPVPDSEQGDTTEAKPPTMTGGTKKTGTPGAIRMGAPLNSP